MHSVDEKWVCRVWVAGKDSETGMPLGNQIPRKNEEIRNLKQRVSELQTRLEIAFKEEIKSKNSPKGKLASTESKQGKGKDFKREEASLQYPIS